MTSRIEVNPRIRFGKPCIAGTRIAVQEVLELVLDGAAVEELIRDFYPSLSIDDIKVCIEFAANS